MREHELNPGSDKDRTCQHCDSIFSSHGLYRIHLKQGCSRQKEVECNACKVVWVELLTYLNYPIIAMQGRQECV